METKYYVSVFPTQALIASQLTPEQFGAYMATGKKNGSFERIVFLEVSGKFGDYFDWDYAQRRCTTHPDGRPKNSLWLSVYRVLEHCPIEEMKSLYLTTLDGRTLELEPSGYSEAQHSQYYVYNELCPINPLVVSKLNPREFGTYMTDPANKVSVPKVVFADLKTIDLGNPEHTGNIGPTYDRNIGHFRDCVQDVLNDTEKMNKNVERSHSESFSYNIINRGVFICQGEQLKFYPMLSVDVLRRSHYDWARSAMIL